MRNKHDDDNRIDEEDTCSCCGGEFDHRNLLKLYCEDTPQQPNQESVLLCEDCLSDFPAEMPEEGDNHLLALHTIGLQAHKGDVITEDLWPVLMDYCARNRILSFIPAREQIQDMVDVREWCRALYQYCRYHPEESFHGHVNSANERTWTKQEAECLDVCTQRAYAICETFKQDLCAICCEEDPVCQQAAKESADQAGAKPAIYDCRSGISVAQKMFEALESAKTGTEAAEKWIAMYVDKPGHDAAARAMLEVIRPVIAQTAEAIEAYKAAVQS